MWHDFWAAKLAVMGTRGISIFTRSIRHGHEKGIDVRIAIDLVRLALDDEYDVGLIFSQDQDLSEATEEVKVISRKQGKWRRLVSAYPVSSAYLNNRGIDKTDWIKIDKTLYDQCIDPLDYRPKSRFNPLTS